MRARILPSVCGVMLLAACTDTTAIKKFAQTAPTNTNIQAAAESYDQALTNAENYNDALESLDPAVLGQLKTERDAQAKLIVANAQVISQYMNELGAVAGLDTNVSAQANNNLKQGLSALQKTGKIAAPEVAVLEALANFIGGMIESGVQHYSLHKVITEENKDFQLAVQSELLVIADLRSSIATERNLLGELGHVTKALETKTESCQRGASEAERAVEKEKKNGRQTKPAITNPFFREGCAPAFASLMTYPSWYAVQEAQLDASDSLAKNLGTAFTSIGKAHQQLYGQRNNLLTPATWDAIKSNVENARTALAAVKGL